MMAAMSPLRGRLALAFLSMALAILACSLPGRSAPAPSATPQPTATDTATPAPTATPTPTPTPEPRRLLERAERAFLLGDWEQALGSFEAAREQATEAEERRAAALGQARTLLEAGQPEAALTILNSMEDSLAESPEASLVRGLALGALERWREAAEAYQDYLERGGSALRGYALEWQGDAWAYAGEPAKAREAYQLALQYDPQRGDVGVEIKLANSQRASGDLLGAIERFQAIYDSTSDGFLKAQMNLLLGRALLALGDAESAYGRYLDAVMNYPSSFDSYTALVALVEAGIPVDELQRGIVDYYAGQYGVALAAFNRYLISPPEDHDGRIHYFRGLTLRALGEHDAALEEFRTLIDTHPEDPLVADAWEEAVDTLWAYLDDPLAAISLALEFASRYHAHARAPEFLFLAARIAEREGDLARAADLWRRTASEYPQAANAFRAQFLSGIAGFRLGEYAGAETAFLAALDLARESEDDAAAQLWIGKSRQAQGQHEAAQQAFKAAELADPSGYYGLRARDLSLGRQPFESLAAYTLPDEAALQQARAELQAWLRTRFGLPAGLSLDGLDGVLLGDSRFQRGEALWRLGLYEQAKQEFDRLRSEFWDDAEHTYRLMEYFINIGHYRSAIYGAVRLLQLAGLDQAPAEDQPLYLRYVRFGPYFGDVILPQALDKGLDGLFVLSVVRQESLFEGFATSYAAARGLMQIIPSTGEHLAAAEGWPPEYDVTDLHRPIVSVRLGVRYLAEQRDLFDGDLCAALAAYNAGPGNALAWKALAGDDPDLFVEVVRFQQTRDYIRSISWAFAHYRALYGGG